VTDILSKLIILPSEEFVNVELWGLAGEKRGFLPEEAREAGGKPFMRLRIEGEAGGHSRGEVLWKGGADMSQKKENSKGSFDQFDQGQQAKAKSKQQGQSTKGSQSKGQ
jgi:hypothetical protein